MRFIVPTVLLLVAAIHALPVVGVLGAQRLSMLYGATLDDPDVVLLLRHRAVLFGLLAVLLAYAATRPDLHRLGLLAGLVSVASFLLLAYVGGPLGAPLLKVVYADWAALVLLLVGAAAHLARRG